MPGRSLTTTVVGVAVVVNFGLLTHVTTTVVGTIVVVNFIPLTHVTTSDGAVNFDPLTHVTTSGGAVNFDPLTHVTTSGGAVNFDPLTHVATSGGAVYFDPLTHVTTSGGAVNFDPLTHVATSEGAVNFDSLTHVATSDGAVNFDPLTHVTTSEGAVNFDLLTHVTTSEGAVNFDLLTHVTAAVVDAVVTLPRRLFVVYGSEGRPISVRVLVYQRGCGVGCNAVVTPVIEGLHRYRGYLGGVVEILLGRGLCSLPHHVGNIWAEGLHCENIVIILQPGAIIFTVVPIMNGHPWDQAKVSLHAMWPLIRERRLPSMSNIALHLLKYIFVNPSRLWILVRYENMQQLFLTMLEQNVIAKSVMIINFK